MNRRALLILLLLGTTHLFAQNKTTDSLLNALKTAKDDTNKVLLLNKLSHLEVNMGRNSIADSLLHSALNIAITLQYKRGIANSNNHLGIIYDNSGNYTKALDCYGNALKIYEEFGDRKAIASQLNNMGYVYHNQGNYSKALEYFFREMNIGDSLNNKDIIARASNLIGNVYLAESDYDKALDYYQKALNIDLEIKDEEGVAYIYNNLGIIYQNKNDRIKALYYYNRGLEKCKELDDKTGVVALLDNIGDIYASNNELDTALTYYHMSLDSAKEIDDKEQIVQALNNIGNVCFKQKNYPQALDYQQKSLAIAKATGFMDGVKASESSLSDIYTATGDNMKALEHYKQYIAIRDSLFNKQNTKKIVQAEMNFQFEKKQADEKAEQDKKDALQKVQAHKQTITIYFISGILLLVLGFAFFAYRSNLQKKKANQELDDKNKKIEFAYKTIEEKNHEITDSINYAKRIQHAILPEVDEMKKALPESFILFMPKDIVSGDFYFYHTAHPQPFPVGREKNVNTQVLPTGEDLGGAALFIAAADCTGHGVPGAFMSMIGSEKLQDAVQQHTITGDILAHLNKGIRASLHQSGEQGATRDGMDIALCKLKAPLVPPYSGKSDTLPTGEGWGGAVLTYSGANRPLWIIRKEATEMEEIRPTKAAIGGFTEADQKFDTHKITLKKGDTFYLFTDGYADQFGGEEGKKLTTKRFRELVLSLRNQAMDAQKKELATFIEKWKGNREQLDDILIIGVRI